MRGGIAGMCNEARLYLDIQDQGLIAHPAFFVFTGHFQRQPRGVCRLAKVASSETGSATYRRLTLGAKISVDPATRGLRTDFVGLVLAVGQREGDREWKLALGRSARKWPFAPKRTARDHVETRHLIVFRFDNSHNIALESPFAVGGFQMKRTRKPSCIERKLEGFDFAWLPHWRLAAGVVHQMEAGDSVGQRIGKLPGDQCAMLLGRHPQIVPRQGGLKCLLPHIVRRLVAAEHLRMNAHDKATCWRLIGPAWIESLGLRRHEVNRLELIQGVGQDLFHTVRVAMVRKTKQLAVGGSYVEPLRCVIEVVAGTLAGDLSVELPFIVLLTPLKGLVDGDRNESGLEQLDDFRIGEGRRTVDDSVVSRTA